jgi:short-subunit dehydrogenase
VGGHTHDYTRETWDRAIDTNLKGVAYGIQAAYPVMVKQGFGHIVNIASLAGLIATGAMAAYCATKHGVVGLSKSLRAEAKAYGVRVSVVCPGIVRTEILDGGKHGILHGISSEEMKSIFESVANPMDADVFAGEMLKDVARNKAIIILPRSGRIAWWLTKLLPPSFELRLAEKSSIIEAKKRLRSHQ